MEGEDIRFSIIEYYQKELSKNQPMPFDQWVYYWELIKFKNAQDDQRECIKITLKNWRSCYDF